MKRLFSHSNCPPGEFFYKARLENGQEIVHYGVCKGVPNCRRFGPSPEINTMARELVDWRRGNNLPRATFEAALEDIDFYTCQRLGFDKQWCYDTDKSFAETTTILQSSGGCSGCGAQIN